MCQHRHLPEECQVVGLFLRATLAGEVGDGDGAGAASAALVQQDHAELGHGAREPGGGLKRAGSGEAGAACGEEEREGLGRHS